MSTSDKARDWIANGFESYVTDYDVAKVLTGLISEIDRLTEQVTRLEAELSRYRQGVEVYNVRIEKVFNNYEQLTKGEVRFQLPSQYIGQRVTVLVMKEGGDEI